MPFIRNDPPDAAIVSWRDDEDRAHEKVHPDERVRLLARGRIVGRGDRVTHGEIIQAEANRPDLELLIREVRNLSPRCRR